MLVVGFVDLQQLKPRMGGEECLERRGGGWHYGTWFPPFSARVSGPQITAQLFLFATKLLADDEYS